MTTNNIHMTAQKLNRTTKKKNRTLFRKQTGQCKKLLNILDCHKNSINCVVETLDAAKINKTHP